MKITRLSPAFAAGLLSLGLAAYAASAGARAKAPATFLADDTVPLNAVCQPQGSADYAQAVAESAVSGAVVQVKAIKPVEMLAADQ